MPHARSVKKSKPVEDVLSEIVQLVQNGFLEIVLTGINIGNYLCPQTGADLAQLCEKIAAMPGKFRVRFSSIELPTVTDGVITQMHQHPARFCNYFHLPLQAGCDKILKDMNRHYTTADYAARVQDLRREVPQIGIFADVIAGYPTESETDFETTFAFIKAQKLAGLHVFSYSPRPGTPAAKLPQLSPEEIKRRAEKLRALDKDLRGAFASSLVGTEQEVFIEEKKGANVHGITSNFQQVFLPPNAQAHGLVRVKIIRAENNVCYGEVI